MAVYKKTYRPYEGSLTPSISRPQHAMDGII